MNRSHLLTVAVAIIGALVAVDLYGTPRPAYNSDVNDIGRYQIAVWTQKDPDQNAWVIDTATGRLWRLQNFGAAIPVGELPPIPDKGARSENNSN
jgi:hypothetical protein